VYRPLYCLSKSTKSAFASQKMTEQKAIEICTVALSASRRLGMVLTVESRPAVIGGTEAEAKAKGLAKAKELWPATEGWYDHQAAAMALDYSTGRVIGLMMLTREEFCAEVIPVINAAQEPAKKKRKRA
jgi:hypothetical protein